MAGFSIGNFGAYNHAYSRYTTKDDNIGKINDGKDYDNTVWVIKRYVPTDLRLTAPVPRHKLIAPDASKLSRPEPTWIHPREPVPQTFQRDQGNGDMFRVSQPSTRCEEWSTLRQMLPSRGQPDHPRPPNWGTGFAEPPNSLPNVGRRFQHINSPMTRYVDSMHLTNRLFKLH